MKTWKFDDPKLPKLTSVKIVKKAVLQKTDIKANNNKYYAIELHSGKGKPAFRVFTHYGRTDDLDSNPDAGQKECRYFPTLAAAQSGYDSIYRQKTSARKGYKELNLASTKIGSQAARGTSSGKIDAKTMKLADAKREVRKPKAKKKVTIEKPVQDLVKYLYSEATAALTNTVAAKITAQGIETPLGVLTLGQIEKGEEILDELYSVFKSKSKTKKKELVRMSGDFYTHIPHKIGRSRKSVDQAVIDTMEEFRQKQETLQLMKDMLKVNGDADAGESVLYDGEVQSQYEALGCELVAMEAKSAAYKKIADHVVDSQVTHKRIKVKRIFTVKRKDEWKAFAKVGNEKLLFHGSNIKNWVGILSRGILLPKIVVSLGVDRTDEGWLGSGIYFGDASCTAGNYTVPGKQKTRFMAVTRVALGKIKQFNKITYGLKSPPKGFHSCHGVRGTEFDDDEFVIYEQHQQRLEYLVEFTM